MWGLRNKTSEHQGDCIIFLKQIKQQSDSTLYKRVNFFFQTTFHYTSQLWSNKVDSVNLPGGKTGLDTHETKLPTYWNTPFNKICLGMKIGQQFKSVVINHQARSLYSLIADGKYRATSLGRNSWKKLIGSRASLYSPTVTRKDSTYYAPMPPALKQELVSLPTIRMCVALVTPESGLAPERSSARGR